MFHQTIHKQDSCTATKGSSCEQMITVGNFIFKYTVHLIIYPLALCIEYLLRLMWPWKSRMQVDDWRTQPVQKQIAVIPSCGVHKMSLPGPRLRDSPQQQISTRMDSSHTLSPTAQDELVRAKAERPSSKQQTTVLVKPPKETTRYVNSLLIL